MRHFSSFCKSVTFERAVGQKKKRNPIIIKECSFSCIVSISIFIWVTVSAYYFVVHEKPKKHEDDASVVRSPTVWVHGEWRDERRRKWESTSSAHTKYQWKMCFNIRAQNFWHNFFSAQTTNVNVRLVRTTVVTDREFCVWHAFTFRKNIHLFVCPSSTPRRRCRQQNVFIFQLFIFFIRGALRHHSGWFCCFARRRRALAHRPTAKLMNVLCLASEWVCWCWCHALHRQRLEWKCMHNYVDIIIVCHFLRFSLAGSEFS